jgi:hypothetical protein
MSIVFYLPEQACGGSGNIKVVELLRRATIEPSDCGLKLLSCCIKSEHSISATSGEGRREERRERRTPLMVLSITTTAAAVHKPAK